MAAPPPILHPRKLRVASLPSDLSEEGLRNVCEKFGKVEKIKLVPGSAPDACDAFAFVLFEEAESAAKALAAFGSLVAREVWPHTVSTLPQHSQIAIDAHYATRRGGGKRGGSRGKAQRSIVVATVSPDDAEEVQEDDDCDWDCSLVAQQHRGTEAAAEDLHRTTRGAHATTSPADSSPTQQQQQQHFRNTGCHTQEAANSEQQKGCRRAHLCARRLSGSTLSQQSTTSSGTFGRPERTTVAASLPSVAAQSTTPLSAGTDGPADPAAGGGPLDVLPVALGEGSGIRAISAALCWAGGNSGGSTALAPKKKEEESVTSERGAPIAGAAFCGFRGNDALPASFSGCDLWGNVGLGFPTASSGTVAAAATARSAWITTPTPGGSSGSLADSLQPFPFSAAPPPHAAPSSPLWESSPTIPLHAAELAPATSSGAEVSNTRRPCMAVTCPPQPVENNASIRVGAAPASTFNSAVPQGSVTYGGCIGLGGTAPDGSFQALQPLHGVFPASGRSPTQPHRGAPPPPPYANRNDRLSHPPVGVATQPPPMPWAPPTAAGSGATRFIPAGIAPVPTTRSVISLPQSPTYCFAEPALVHSAQQAARVQRGFDQPTKPLPSRQFAPGAGGSSFLRPSSLVFVAQEESQRGVQTAGGSDAAVPWHMAPQQHYLQHQQQCLQSVPIPPAAAAFYQGPTTAVVFTQMLPPAMQQPLQFLLSAPLQHPQQLTSVLPTVVPPPPSMEGQQQQVMYYVTFSS